MKVRFKLLFTIVVTAILGSCVKNTPFFAPYSVPEVYRQESKDSSALARVIMVHALDNYLGTSVNTTIVAADVDSLWLNRGKPFTNDIASGFLYTPLQLNNMTRVNINDNTGDADSLKNLADSVVALSRFYGVTAANGVAGVRTQSGSVSTKRLFNELGMEIKEIWFNTMLGASSMKNAFDNLAGPGAGAGTNWDLSYNYMGFPVDYNPDIDYNTGTSRPNRPLGVATLFAGVKNLNAGSKIYEEYRRARAAAVAGDGRVNAISIANILGYTEVTLAQSALFALDSVKLSADPVAKLHYLSKAHGLVRALKYRNPNISPLADETYLQVRAILKTNFYTLTQEAGYTGINQAQSLLVNAYNGQ